MTLPGRSLGLFEHPTIWAFLLLQIVLPITMRSSLRALSNGRGWFAEVRSRSDAQLRDPVLSLHRFAQLRDALSQSVASLFYLIGLAAFVWNTYQNQRPLVALSYDFWDSSLHAWGYWTTRVYKLYLFAWLLPYLALLHAGVLIVILSFIREARKSAALRLIPYHVDDLGGLGEPSSLVSNPWA